MILNINRVVNVIDAMVNEFDSAYIVLVVCFFFAWKSRVDYDSVEVAILMLERKVFQISVIVLRH